MENKMMMPASYNVLSNEEMTYTEGGAGEEAIVTAWAAYGTGYAIGAFVGAAISLGNMIWGVSKTTEWVKKEKAQGASFSEIVSKGADATFNYMGKSIWNSIVGVYTAVNLTVWWPVTAIAWAVA